MKSTACMLLLAISAARAESFWDWIGWDDDELDRHIVVDRHVDSATAPVQEIAVAQTGEVVVVQPEIVYEPSSRTWGYYRSSPRHEERVAFVPPHERIVQEVRHEPEVAVIHHDEEQPAVQKEAPREQPPAHNLFNAPSERPSRERGAQH